MQPSAAHDEQGPDPFVLDPHIDSHPLLWKLDNALQGKDIIDVRSLNVCDGLSVQHIRMFWCFLAARACAHHRQRTVPKLMVPLHAAGRRHRAAGPEL